MTLPPSPSLYKPDEYVWCERCRRVECAGAVLHDGPYTLGNSRPATNGEIATAVQPRLPLDRRSDDNAHTDGEQR